jgi:hypothetical protein
MVLSIMGILGVNLNPEDFDSDDRHTATISLLQKLLEKGYGVEWLGLAPNVRTPAGLGTLPMMPKTSVGGRAFVETEDGEKEVATILEKNMLAMWWWLDGVPNGSIDNLGNLTIKTKALPISRCTGTPVKLQYLQSTHPSIIVDYATSEGWSLEPLAQSTTFALNLGQKRFYRHGFLPKIHDPNSTLLILLKTKTVATKVGYSIIGFAWGVETLTDDWPFRGFMIFA